MSRLSIVLILLAVAGLATANPEIDQEQVCLECHDNLAAELASPVAHPPAATGECTACHNPHVSRFAALLQDRPGPLCLTCHADLQEELERDVVHAPVAEGRCADCHPPHGATHDKLLSAPKDEICVTCHAEVAEWQERSVSHSPFRRGKCSICHEAHAAPNDGLVRRTVDRMCLMCHRNEEKMRSAHRGYPIESAPESCLLCHDPHASQRAGLFQPQLHMPFEDGACDGCHVAPQSAEPFKLTASVDELCADCHDDIVEEIATSAIAHPVGECTTCHNPHMGADHLLLDKMPDLCLGCHDPGGASSGEPGLYTTHADLNCATCHGSHGHERTDLLRQNPIALCGGCHDHEHTVTHPMGDKVVDPRNGTAMDCLSCHGLHDAPYEDYLKQSGDRELCLDCHKELADR